jgi:anion-transporting  ArsA/GET3 family ATPase
MLHSSLTAVHLVTTPAAMPVQETVDAYRELTAADLPVGHLVLNRVAGAKAVEVDREVIAAGLDRAGLAADEDTVAGLMAEYAAARTEIESVDAYRDRLEQLGRPVEELPLLPEGVDLSGLYQLARELRPGLTGGRRPLSGGTDAA